MSPEEKTRLTAAARAYLGTPWLGQGRDKRGLDCTGLCVMTYRDAGFPVDEGPVDYRSVDAKRLMRTLEKHCRPVGPDENLEVGDIVVFRFPDAGHVAILIDGRNGLNAIHCPQFGEVVEARFDPKRGTIKGFYRWQGE